MKSKIFVITGLPASGKTTIGQKLAAHFQIPFISKDSIKELIFDSLGNSDREFSKKVGLAAYTLMYEFADELLKNGQSFILESNFKPQFDNKIFKEIKNKYCPEFIQILCWADGQILFERFKNRAESGNRHPGHVDTNNLEEFKPVLLQGRSETLDLDGKLIEVETTDFTKVNIDKIIKEI